MPRFFLSVALVIGEARRNPGMASGRSGRTVTTDDTSSLVLLLG